MLARMTPQPSKTKSAVAGVAVTTLAIAGFLAARASNDADLSQAAVGSSVAPAAEAPAALPARPRLVAIGQGSGSAQFAVRPAQRDARAALIAILKAHPGLKARLLGGVGIVGAAAGDGTATNATLAASYDGAPQVSDLLSPIVAPGAPFMTAVSMSLDPLGSGNLSTPGATIVILRDRDQLGEPPGSGSAVGNFAIASQTQALSDDGTAVVFTITGTNIDSTAHRFVADFAYGAGSGSGS